MREQRQRLLADDQTLIIILLVDRGMSWGA
jgi:hypothetical protein